MYLNKEVILQEDAVEKCFCIPFLALKKHQMTQEQSEFFIMICMSDSNSFEEMEKKAYKEVWIYAAMRKRMENSLNVRIDLKILLFITFAYRNVGINMMFLYALQYWAKKNNKKEVTFDDFSMDIYAMGFPVESEMHTVWEGQKVSGSPDNLIDYNSACKSIML